MMKVTILGLIETVTIMLIGILTWTLVSCVTTSPVFVDNELVFYKAEFIAKTKYKETNFLFYSIKFMSLPGRTVGTCNSGNKDIFIDPSFWYRSNNKTKQALIFHEFGHCICFKKHYNEEREDECPVSIMNKHIPDPKCLKKHWDSYMEDYFERCE